MIPFECRQAGRRWVNHHTGTLIEDIIGWQAQANVKPSAGQLNIASLNAVEGDNEVRPVRH